MWLDKIKQIKAIIASKYLEEGNKAVTQRALNYTIIHKGFYFIFRIQIEIKFLKTKPQCQCLNLLLHKLAANRMIHQYMYVNVP